MSGSKFHLVSMAAVLVLLAATLDPGPLGAGEGRAAVTRPSGGSSSGSGSISSGSSSSGSGSSGSGRSTISNDSRGSAGPTRPSGDSSGRTVIRDDRRTQHSHHGHHGHHGTIHFGFRSYYPWHSSWYWGPWGYGPWGYGTWGHPYGYGHHGYPVTYAGSPGYGMGALDLNVRPKDAEVHVNGQYVGLVRQYDGFPGYLWLERGTYEIAFYRPGHQTVTRPFEIFTGLVLDVSIDLPPGEAVLPARSEGYAAPQVPSGVPAEIPAGAAPATEAARVRLEVLPREASVYLDGRFVGTGEELARLHDGLIAEPGAHVVEVVGPGRVPETVHFELGPGEEARIEVRLDPAVDA